MISAQGESDCTFHCYCKHFDQLLSQSSWAVAAWNAHPPAGCARIGQGVFPKSNTGGPVGLACEWELGLLSGSWLCCGGSRPALAMGCCA